MTINSKTFVVTGGGSGLGREIVLGLLNRGARVAAIDINEESLKETFNLAGHNNARLSTHVVDITDKELVLGLPEKIIGMHKQIDAIINNAGIIQPFVRVNDLDLEKAEKVMQINFYGQLYIVKAFLPYLIERPEAHIANVSSMGSFFVVPGQTIYGASKAAVSMLTKGLEVELRNTNVKTTLAIPGAMNTNIYRNSGQKMDPELEKMQANSKVLSAEKAAEIFINAIEKNKKIVLIGTDAKVLNILNKIAPNLTTSLFNKFIGSKLIKD